jgi:hypothetical protein
MHFVQKKPQ